MADNSDQTTSLSPSRDDVNTHRETEFVAGIHPWYREIFADLGNLWETRDPLYQVID